MLKHIIYLLNKGDMYSNKLVIAYMNLVNSSKELDEAYMLLKIEAHIDSLR